MNSDNIKDASDKSFRELMDMPFHQLQEKAKENAPIMTLEECVEERITLQEFYNIERAAYDKFVEDNIDKQYEKKAYLDWAMMMFDQEVRE